MAVGNLQVSRGRCPTCKAKTKLERNAQVWGFGDLVMIFLTLGLWVVLKFWMRPALRCSQCGSKV